MPILQVRDVPDHIYRALAEQAEQERRSLAQQVVAVLARGLNLQIDPKTRRNKVLDAVQTGDHAAYGSLPDPVRLIREDRKR
jgi:hypothetical protein